MVLAHSIFINFYSKCSIFMFSSCMIIWSMLVCNFILLCKWKRSFYFSKLSVQFQCILFNYFYLLDNVFLVALNQKNVFLKSISFVICFFRISMSSLVFCLSWVSFPLNDFPLLCLLMYILIFFFFLSDKYNYA